MSVFVDDMRAPYRRMLMCHMIADTSDELLAMADLIGVARRWLQHPGTAREHFDIALVKRDLAVKAGAIEITWRQCGLMTHRRGIEGVLGHPEEALAWVRARQQGRTTSETATGIVNAVVTLYLSAESSGLQAGDRPPSSSATDQCGLR